MLQNGILVFCGRQSPVLSWAVAVAALDGKCGQKPPPLLRAPHLSPAQRSSQLGPAQQGDDLFYHSFPCVCHDQQAGDLPLQRRRTTNRGRLCLNPYCPCNFASRIVIACTKTWFKNFIYTIWFFLNEEMLLAALLDRRKSVKTKAGVEGTYVIGFVFS